jgi:hypothetical protein
MAGFLHRHLKRATPKRLLAAAALLGAYGWWTFAETSPWTKPYAALGAEMPELIAGFPTGEPATAIERLAAARGDYLWFQAFDIPFAILVAIAGATAIALGLKRLRLDTGDARSLLLAPAIYLFFELVENGLLALFAAGVAAPDGAPAAAQQVATVGKLAALLLTSLLAIAGVAVAVATGISRSVRRPL